MSVLHGTVVGTVGSQGGGAAFVGGVFAGAGRFMVVVVVSYSRVAWAAMMSSSGIVADVERSEWVKVRGGRCFDRGGNEAEINSG